MPRHNYAAELSNDHPDPGMRPGLDALRSKLRSISLLENKPEAVEWLIKDMAWFFFTREAKRPHALERLIASFHLYASSASVQPDPETEPISVTTEDASSSRSLPLIIGTDLHNLIDEYVGRRFSDEYNPLAYRGQEEEPVKGGGSPDLNDKGLMKRARIIIFDHTLRDGEGMSDCDCGESFEFMEEWAGHVRKLIWKELRSG